MLFFLVFLPEKYQSNKKKVDAQVNSFMLPDFIPGLFHFLTPMDVIKNQYAVFVKHRQ